MAVGYLESEKRTMSEELLPRAKASCLPSGDQAKHQIWPEVKWVNCFAGPVKRAGRIQMLGVPLEISRKPIDLLSGAQA